MAPNKFENYIKKQLEEREIKPSVNAWGSLSEKLDATTAPQSKKRGYFWYGVAASFIGLLIVSVSYFSIEDPTRTPDIQIVDTNDEAIEDKTNTKIIEENNIEEVVVKVSKIKPSLIRDDKAIDKNPIPELKDQIATVDDIDASNDFSVEKAVTPNEFESEIINTKILEIVSTIDSLELNNTVLTNVEVDNLLRNAQEEILRDKLFNQNGQVDAMALLTEVEDELDQSFRDQIFKSLKTGFLKVRTAVADRNN